jgi:hypothetical protein
LRPVDLHTQLESKSGLVICIPPVMVGLTTVPAALTMLQEEIWFSLCSREVYEAEAVCVSEFKKSVMSGCHKWTLPPCHVGAHWPRGTGPALLASRQPDLKILQAALHTCCWRM